MISLYYKDFSELLHLDTPLSTICLEKPSYFSKVMRDLNDSMNGAMDFRLSKDGTMLSMAKNALLVTDFINYDGIIKKLNSLLLKKMANKSAIYSYEWNEIYALGYQLVQKMSDEMQFAVDIEEECDYSAFLKLYNPSIPIANDSVPAMVEQIMNIATDFLDLRLLILVQARGYFEDEELLLLSKNCAYKEVPLLCIESSVHKKLSCEKILVIDKDLCEIQL